MGQTESERIAADLAADPRQLERDALIALVERLQTLADRQQAAIATQAAALADRRPTAAPNGQARPGRAAKPIAGFDFTIVFDGGALGNPGKGYGSFQIVSGEGVVAAGRLDFGDGVTNNQAEFRTLIRALEALAERQGDRAAQTSVAVRGDSQLVINTVNGSWKARHPELIPLRDRAKSLLGRFGKSDVAWHRRGASVRVLGH
ncbi:MAG TPA: ribonuclease HI family protein [Thermomicrobiales bacterium]|nr:ribonuclease HI family protein [Thermomicrobiales bacterium]